MAIQYGVALQNAQLFSIENDIAFFTTPLLVIFAGAPPASADTVESATRLLVMNLPTDFFATPSGGVMTKTGSWQGTAIATGVAGHFRFLTTSGSTTGRIQGSVGTSAADLIVDNVNFVAGQIFTVITFTVTHNQG